MSLGPAAFAIVFIAMWVAVSTLLARVGGWTKLARRFRAVGPFTGRKKTFCRGQMGGVTNYNGVLTLGASDQGLYLAVFAPFRAGHPALLIPRHEVRLGLRKTRFLAGESVTLHLGVSEDVTLELPARTADALLADTRFEAL